MGGKKMGPARPPRFSISASPPPKARGEAANARRRAAVGRCMGGCLGRARRSDDADRANKMGSNNATSPAPAAAGGPATRFGFASDFAACFDLGKELGAGQFGTTFACAPKPNGRWDAQGPPDGSAPPASGYAVKVIPKRILTSKEAIEDVKKEVSIMRTLAGASENIVRLYEAFEDSKAVYLVMEKCNGGELFDRIIAKGHFSEADAAKIVRQMLQVVAQCHLNGVMHRDLSACDARRGAQAHASTPPLPHTRSLLETTRTRRTHHD